MTEQELIGGILEREGGYSDVAADRGGPTNYGITAASWGLYLGLGRIATREEVHAITREQAVMFYQTRYIDQSPFKRVAHEPTRTQLVDFGINSGNVTATKWLQRAIGVPDDGIIGKLTLDALNAYPPRLVNNALVAARLAHYHEIIDGDKTQKVFEDGWDRRAVSFFIGT